MDLERLIFYLSGEGGNKVISSNMAFEASVKMLKNMVDLAIRNTLDKVFDHDCKIIYKHPSPGLIIAELIEYEFRACLALSDDLIYALKQLLIV
jgi:hypothetical protein